MARNLGRRGLGLVLVAAMGCSNSGAPALSTSMAKAKVSGVVTAKGKPVKKGSIIFNAANAQRKNVAPVEVEIGPGGKYELETLSGTNRVIVRTREGGPAAGSGYNKALEIKEGDNTQDIEVTDQ